jgi:hypothetical protein
VSSVKQKTKPRRLVLEMDEAGLRHHQAVVLAHLASHKINQFKCFSAATRLLK